MALDPYSSCPCGSGKKFKWCCQNIFVDIEKAFQQEQEGQHDNALRILDEVIKKHPDNPEAWGRKAQLLFNQGRGDEAEEVLQKAFDLNPNYAWGLLMQAQIRAQEGELQGALILARKAVEAYDPEAREYLAQAYSIIADAELSRNRPVAAQAALRILLRLSPESHQLREVMQQAFGPESRLPECARQPYTLRRRPEGMPPERQRAWDQALSQVNTPRLSSMASAFERLTTDEPQDTTAWYNLAIVQAWLGESRKALDALEKYIEQETDESKAAEAGALGEVLRCGQGLEDVSDYHEYRVEYRVQNMEALGKLLNDWNNTERMIVLPSQDQSVLPAMLLEPVTANVLTTGQSLVEERKLAGYLLLVGDRMRVWGPREEAVNRLREELKTRTALGVSEGTVQRAHVTFPDTVAEGFLFPIGLQTPELQRQRILEYAQGYFEETWIRHPLVSLGGNPPADAVGQPTLRKKLLGVIRFLQDCAQLGILNSYDFDRVRRKLGLASEPAPAAATGTLDMSTISAAELSALSVDSLSDQQLESAYQAAQKLDDRELSGHFARALVSRPITDTQDRYPLYSFLVQQALNEGNTDEALNYVNDGEQVDCEHNEGRRRNDYELRRGQVHVNRREPDLAHDVFTRLIERQPDNLKFRGTAAEGMLSLRQPERARQFAEGGLEVARRQNDRDAEGHLMELLEAANKQGQGG
jgi:tetratricopeptide (TPR) repeat protein